jgi:endoglycosylceramidase
MTSPPESGDLRVMIRRAGSLRAPMSMQGARLAVLARIACSMRLLALAFVLAVALAGALTPAARAAPTLPLGHSGRWITDAAGRVVIVHGTNMVYKPPPYYPAAIGFGDDDAAFLESIGFNAVRVGVIWKAVEPGPGVFDDGYLNQIAATVATLASHGIVSLLDFHQDQYNELFQGEGAPDWAVEDGGLPNPGLGFPGNYLANPALQHALDQFWANAPGPDGVGLQNWFAGAWAHVAARFRGDRAVLGYELYNEPWPGTTWEQCAGPTGCPDFDAGLTAFYAKVRGADPDTLVWYEPNVLFNEGSSTYVGTVGDPRTGFAFHDYCLTESETSSPAGCDPFDDLVFSNAISHVASTGQALLETEFGATDDTADLTEMVQRADRDMVPWLEWAYCGCNDPTTTGPGTKQAIVVDPSKPPTGSNLILPTLEALVEPYPQVIAGTPVSWGFDTSSKTFSLRYSTARASGSGRFPKWSVTQIATPALVYSGHYSVSVHGGAIVSLRGASVLQIESCPGAQSVSVSVTSGGASHGTCKAPRHHVRHKRKRRRRHRHS